jgi:ABC-type Fe3+/spermidine/putrescine transport system ATPase subunit
VFARPASAQVARLLGIPNLIHATVTGPGELTVGGTGNGPGLRVMARTDDLPAGAAVLWTIRPDHVTVLAGTVLAGTGVYPAVVDDIADIGTLTILTVRLRTGQDEEPELRVRTTAAPSLEPGDHCSVRLNPADITAWPATLYPS